MAADKKVILIFTSCDGQAIAGASTPALTKLLQKGAVFTNVACEGDAKVMAGAGAPAGEAIWDAAGAAGMKVAGLGDGFDMAVLDAGASLDDVEGVVAQALEAADRTTVTVVVAKGAIVFSGPGFAKGKVVDKKICPCVVAPTVAYVANYPLPAQCEGPVAYAALKDINYKLNEINKLKEAIVNMEAAIERKGRQPWDKHDCA